MSVPSAPTPESDASSLLANVRVVLCQTSHPGNIGACARAMKTMGLHQLVLVNPKFFPHPEAEAMAARAADVLEAARVCENLDQALTGTVYAAASTARQRDLSHAVLSPREAAARLTQEARHGPVALVMGAEKYGLTAEEVNRFSVITMVPASAEYSSLNLAAAVQVFATELRLAALAPALPQQFFEPATHEARAVLYAPGAHAARRRLSRSGGAQATDATHAPPVCTCAPGARRGEHPARHPRRRPGSGPQGTQS